MVRTQPHNLGNDQKKNYIRPQGYNHQTAGYSSNYFFTVLLPTRTRLLLADGHSCYRPRRTGERKRKSVRGAITGLDLAVLALSIVKQGEGELPGLTDTVVPKRLGPKRATKIRRFFGLDKKDDVRKFVIRRTVTKEGKQDYTKAPKIQRLVTPQRLQRKRQRVAIKRRRAETARDAA